MGAAVEAEANLGGASIVGVLDELLEYGGALGVVNQDLANAPGEVYPLPEILEQPEVGSGGGTHPPSRSRSTDGRGRRQRHHPEKKL